MKTKYDLLLDKFIKSMIWTDASEDVKALVINNLKGFVILLNEMEKRTTNETRIKTKDSIC